MHSAGNCHAALRVIKDMDVALDWGTLSPIEVVVFEEDAGGRIGAAGYMLSANVEVPGS